MARMFSWVSGSQQPRCVSFGQQRLQLSPPNLDELGPWPVYGGEARRVQLWGFGFVSLGGVVHAGRVGRVTVPRRILPTCVQVQVVDRRATSWIASLCRAGSCGDTVSRNWLMLALDNDHRAVRACRRAAVNRRPSCRCCRRRTSAPGGRRFRAGCLAKRAADPAARFAVLGPMSLCRRSSGPPRTPQAYVLHGLRWTPVPA